MKGRTIFGLAILQAARVAHALLSSPNSEYAPHLQVKIASSITKGERRSRERHSGPRKLCDGCHRPPVLCLCEALPPQKLSTKTTVLVLQHPNEYRKKTFSTVPLMSLVLEQVHVKVDYNFELDDLPLVKDYLNRGIRPLLLFPGDDAISLDARDREEGDTEAGVNLKESSLREIQASANLLILLDGTWAEAKRTAIQSPCLFDRCQQVQFSAPGSCLYDAIRKEPEGHCLSTLEACAQALILLEGATEASQCLTGTLKTMVDTKLALEEQRHDEPRQKGKELYERNRRRRQVEKALFHKPKPRVLKDGDILRPLSVDDATLINQNWYHPSASSLQTIQRRLETGVACFGIESDGTLRAYIVRAEDGTLGMLHVEDDFRRRGYGRTLVQESARVLHDLGEPCVTFIMEDDIAVESLFRNLGWVFTDENNMERETMAKKSKRKWILPQLDP
jgi:DTW domain-containing protein YfiP/GNAT superfamily N-acetyltransferase